MPFKGLCINTRKKFSFIKRSRKKARSFFSGITVKTRKAPAFKKHLRCCNELFQSNKLGLVLLYQYASILKPVVGLVKFANGAYTNVQLVYGLIPGDFIKSTSFPSLTQIKNKYQLGYTVLLFWLSKKSVCSHICGENPYKTAFTKSSGTYSVYMDDEADKEVVRLSLPSGENKYVYSTTYVTLGRNSNIFIKKSKFGKAGIRSIFGFRPSVRGVAKNPVDHPNGGRTKAKTPDKTPWGKIAKKGK